MTPVQFPHTADRIAARRFGPLDNWKSLFEVLLGSRCPVFERRIARLASDLFRFRVPFFGRCAMHSFRRKMLRGCVALLCCCGALGLANQAKAELTNGLTAYWNFNESSGTTAANGASWGTPANLNGALMDNAAFVAGGKFGNGVSLDGAGDYVNISSEVLTDFGKACTASVWIYLPAQITLRRAIIETELGAGGYAIGLELNTTAVVHGNMTHNPETYQSANSSIVPSIGAWHLLVATADMNTGSDMKGHLYIDGALVPAADTTFAAGMDLAATAGMHIGTYRSANGRYLTGKVDDIGIWDRAITAAEVSYLWNGGTGNPILVPEPGTLAMFATGLMGLIAYAWRKRK